MTLLQIQYALECAKEGSFTKAAQNLFASASNISKMIKILENELGYEIFIRSSNGITPTKEGLVFLEHANHIIYEVQRISNLKIDSPKNDFIVACQYNPYCLESFISVLHDTIPDLQTYKMVLYSCPDAECIDMVKHHQCDIAITTSMQHELSEYLNLMQYQGIQVEELKRKPISIIVRANHPILNDYIEGEPFDFEKIYDYPLAKVSSPYMTLSSLQRSPAPLSHLIDPRKIISVSTHDWRDAIVANTDAFSIGFAPPQKYMENPARIAIPIPGEHVITCSLTLADNPKNVFTKKFLSAFNSIE